MDMQTIINVVTSLFGVTSLGSIILVLLQRKKLNADVRKVESDKNLVEAQAAEIISKTSASMVTAMNERIQSQDRTISQLERRVTVCDDNCRQQGNWISLATEWIRDADEEIRRLAGNIRNPPSLSPGRDPSRDRDARDGSGEN